MNIPRKYQHEYICCLPQSLESQIMAEVRQNIEQLLLNKEEKQEAIENANLSKVCDLEDTILIQYVEDSKKSYTVFYDYQGKTYSNVWDAESLEDAILDAKHQLEDCKTGYTVLEDMTRNLKENQY